MLVTEVSRQVRASVDSVWSTLAAVGAYPGKVGSYRRVEFLTAETEGLGASWRQTREVFGREHSQVMRVVEWRRPNTLAMEAHEPGARYRTRYRLEAKDAGTSVTVRFEVEPTNVLARLFQRLAGARVIESTRTAMERDLADLARAAEAGEAG